MTPFRTKRTSKVPNRFSSSNTQQGETIIDHNDKSTQTNPNSLLINRSIKLKPIIREPLKVKLPRLRRPLPMATTSDDPIRCKSSDIMIHKIKLPSLSSRKTKNQSNKIESKNNLRETSMKINDKPNCIKNYKEHSGKNLLSKSVDIIESTQERIADPAQESIDNMNTIDRLTNSPISSELKRPNSLNSCSNNNNNHSEDLNGSSHMETVVTQQDHINSSGIRCPCNVDEDLGVMVECESCSTWQHGHCINVGSEEDAYEGYICAYCCMPRDRVIESLWQLTVGDRFQSHFQRLDSLYQKERVSSSGNKSPIEAIENRSFLNEEELGAAIKDTERVYNSLKVKWKLNISSVYEPELRIWQNSCWSEEQINSQESNQGFYFLNKSKHNLKTNIRNMINKLERRCQLIEYNIDLIKDCNSCPHNNNIANLKQTLAPLIVGVNDLKSKLDHNSK